MNEQERADNEGSEAIAKENVIVCPVCGAATVHEKCKVISKSDVCRGRIVYNCAEF